MRVLHFYKTHFPETMGGVEQVIDQIARGAVSRGVQTDVLSLSRAGGHAALAFNGYTVHREKRDFQIASTSFSRRVLPRFRELAARADVLHYHFPWPFMDLVHFASGIRKPSLVTYHSDIVRQKLLLRLYRPVQARFLSSVSGIVATSQNYLATSSVLSDYIGKVSVIPIGLDKQSYPALDPGQRALWRDRLGERFFLFVGMLRYYKGLHILLEAMRDDDLPVVIVGSGPVERELKTQALRYGLRNCHFLGHLSEVDKVALLDLCYAVVFPSHLRSEAFGVSLLEGAMYGKPMISSELGTGTTYINIDGQTGLVVPPSNAVALRDAMRHLWQHPDLAATLGNQAQTRYREIFTADKMVDAYVDLYRRLLA